MAKTESDLQKNCEVEIDEVGKFFLHMLIDYLELFFSWFMNKMV